MSKFRTLSVVVVLVAVLTMGGVIGWTEEEQPRYGGTFVTAVPYEEVVGLDTLRITVNNASTISVTNQIHEGLVKWNTTTLEIEPAIAERWEVSEDGKTYTFYLREGAKFHNGREITAQDFKYSFERMMDPELGGLSTYLFREVVGVNEYLDGTVDHISGIVALGDALSIILKHVDVTFLNGLCEPGATVVPHEEVEKMGLEEFNRAPIGAGPFKFVSWIGNEIKLEAFDGYWTGRPYLDALEIIWMPEAGARGAAFDAEELDGVVAMPVQYARWREDPVVKEHMVEVAELWTRHVGFNTEWGPFKDKRVRQAFNYAIDEKTVVDKYLHGKAYTATGVLPPSMPGYNPELEGYGYDPEKAKELLKEAGYPDGFTVEVKGDPTHPAWGIPGVEAVMPYLEAVGIHVKPLPTEYGTLVEEVVRGDFQGYIDAFGGISMPLLYLSRFHSNNIGTTNWFRYKNSEVDTLLDQATKTIDSEERIKLLQQAEEIIVEDALIWFDNYNKAVFVYQPWVHGLQPFAVDVNYQDYEKVWVDETSPRAGE